ncbi:hypothetical protein POM88_041794 [Heracleum sosnowskyi]|uniref:Cytochrome P450 n=1 Tax=Heracleum sosnowskyi TaxID=360622 RepID=A0AAD8HGL5_9APIA|nr:hypothetical protein POM88_041794 [Heracleum sosnowskyi]
MSELLGGRSLDIFQPVRRQEICSMVNVMLSKAKARVKVDIGAELMRLNNNVLSRIIMRERCSENEDEAGKVKTMIKEVSNVIGIFNLCDYIWFCKKWDLQGIKRKLVGVRGRYDIMMDRIIHEHIDMRRKKKRKVHGDGACTEKDLLDILLDISEDKSMEIRLSIENIKAFILDVFSAETDTTAILTEWAVAELINHPDIMQKAIEEINTVLHYYSDNQAKIVALQITIYPQTLDYLLITWLLAETQSTGKVHLNLNQKRFLLSSEDQASGKKQLDVKGWHFHFLPFGSGQRGCPGSSLALHLVETSLAAIIQCFELEVGSEGDKSDATVDMEEAPRLTLPMAHPLVRTLVARLNPFSCM